MSKHNWKLDKDGNIDWFAGIEDDIHYGPLCLDCNFSECYACYGEILLDECPGKSENNS